MFFFLFQINHYHCYDYHYKGGTVRQGRIVTGSVFVVDKPALNVQLAECGLGAPEAVEVLFHIFLYFGSQ